jgi:putative spermidine/putrescine transport system ATP-binding protein
MTLAGSESPTAGDIDFGARVVTDLPPHLRDVGMVFQRYALFPHLTVTENIGFPLRRRLLPTDRSLLPIAPLSADRLPPPARPRPPLTGR